MDAASERALKDLGIGLLDTNQALEMLQRCMALDGSHYLVFAGDLSKVDGYLNGGREPAAAPPAALAATMVHAAATAPLPVAAVLQGSERERLLEATGKRLKSLFAQVAKLPEDRLDENESLTAYGIDSLMITDLNYQLGQIFGSLSKTLFFEYQTLAQVAAHLVEEDPQTSMGWSGLVPPEPAGNLVLADNKVSVVVNETPAGVLLEIRSVAQPAVAVAAAAAPVPTPAPAVHLPDNAIAVIGLAGRYPHARNVDEFWALLRAGTDCVGEIPADRWTLEDFFLEDVDEAVRQGRSYSKWGAFLEDYDAFDSTFFGISPREAQGMDPQERIFLECCWHVFEDAGYTRQSLQRLHGGRVGVFVGVTTTGFDLNSQAQCLAGDTSFGHTSFASIANRVSYFFDLHGPSLPIDTMCSASLTAVHEACKHLRHGDCELAVAGGVNLYLHPSNYLVMCSQRMLSPDGRCRSFGDNGNGFVPGEGVARCCSSRWRWPRRPPTTSRV